jgi:hypothetical protein
MLAVHRDGQYSPAYESMARNGRPMLCASRRDS